MTLTERYEDLCRTPSDIFEHLPTFVELVHRHDARNVIELGTRTGVSTLAWLYALEGRGHLWSVDIDPAPDIGEFDHWTFVQGDDCSPAVFTQMPAEADIVFIDTSHAYVQTSRELNLYHWLVRKGGVMVLHDTALEHPMDVPFHPPFPVRTALDEFCRAEGFDVEYHTNCFGLGIVNVR